MMYFLKVTYYDRYRMHKTGEYYYTGKLKMFGGELSVIPAMQMNEVKIYSSFKRALLGQYALDNKLADGEIDIIAATDCALF